MIWCDIDHTNKLVERWFTRRLRLQVPATPSDLARNTPRALTIALSFLREYEHIYILLDNQTTVTVMRTGESASSVQSCHRLYSLAKRENMKVRWVSGHSQIRGNEEVNAAARAAIVQIPNLRTRCEYFKNRIKWVRLTFFPKHTVMWHSHV